MPDKGILAAGPAVRLDTTAQHPKNSEAENPWLARVHEALELAEKLDAAGEKVGWIACVTLAAQYLQLAKLFGKDGQL